MLKINCKLFNTTCVSIRVHHTMPKFNGLVNDTTLETTDTDKRATMLLCEYHGTRNTWRCESYVDILLER